MVSGDTLSIVGGGATTVALVGDTFTVTTPASVPNVINTVADNGPGATLDNGDTLTILGTGLSNVSVSGNIFTVDTDITLSALSGLEGDGTSGNPLSINLDSTVIDNQAVITANGVSVSPKYVETFFGGAPYFTNTVLNVIGQVVDSPIYSTIFTNPHPTKDMKLAITFLRSTDVLHLSGQADFILDFMVSINGAPFATFASENYGENAVDSVRTDTMNTITLYHTLAPLANVSLATFNRVTLDSIGVGGSINHFQGTSIIGVYGVNTD